MDSTDRKENCQINQNKFQNSNKNSSINNNIITCVASASCGTRNARLIRLCFKTTAIIETAATKSTSRSNNYIYIRRSFKTTTNSWSTTVSTTIWFTRVSLSIVWEEHRRIDQVRVVGVVAGIGAVLLPVVL